MLTKVWEFPLLAVALSNRKVGFVAVESPLRMDPPELWHLRQLGGPEARERATRKRLLRAIAYYRPRTVLLAHGTRWTLTPVDIRAARRVSAGISDATVEVVTVGDACKVIGCDDSLRAVTLRLCDMYPALEPKLRQFLSGSQRPVDVRDTRPMLSALAVAYAASVAHVVRFG